MFAIDCTFLCLSSLEIQKLIHFVVIITIGISTTYTKHFFRVNPQKQLLEFAKSLKEIETSSSSFDLHLVIDIRAEGKGMIQSNQYTFIHMISHQLLVNILCSAH